MKKAVILLSGGLDSATVVSIAKAEGYELYALSFGYGQRQDSIELSCADKIGKVLGIKDHLQRQIPVITGSVLTDKNVPIPENRKDSEISAGIPVTYVPARNVIFLAHALSFAESCGIGTIFVGFNQSTYPDCQRAFVNSFIAMANTGTKYGADHNFWHIETPLIELAKSDVIRKGLELGTPYEHTVSCYQPVVDRNNREIVSCGKCDSCLLRLRGFESVGVRDPIRYGSLK